MQFLLKELDRSSEMKLPGRQYNWVLVSATKNKTTGYNKSLAVLFDEISCDTD